ncbi:hypothetical protein [Pseudonocardia adelaidensis]|uniref:hypothetical protein n=1 Tax=Pseudonocardia adelaidensis TaxID=648754 RepID=UPI0031EB3DE1
MSPAASLGPARELGSIPLQDRPGDDQLTAVLLAGEHQPRLRVRVLEEDEPGVRRGPVAVIWDAQRAVVTASSAVSRNFRFEGMDRR